MKVTGSAGMGAILDLDTFSVCLVLFRSLNLYSIRRFITKPCRFCLMTQGFIIEQGLDYQDLSLGFGS